MDTGARLAMEAVERGMSGQSLTQYLERFRDSVRRHFSWKALALHPLGPADAYVRPCLGQGAVQPFQQLRLHLVVRIHKGEVFPRCPAHPDRCLASLAAQTYRRIELIVIDDASADGSGGICDRWAAKEPRLQASS